MIFGEGVQYMIAKKVRGMTVFAALAMSVQWAPFANYCKYIVCTSPSEVSISYNLLG